MAELNDAGPRLNYIPILSRYLGPASSLAGMPNFDSLWWALLPPALYFGIHLVEV